MKNLENWKLWVDHNRQSRIKGDTPRARGIIKTVDTTPIVRVNAADWIAGCAPLKEGDRVETRSGTIYRLGKEAH